MRGLSETGGFTIRHDVWSLRHGRLVARGGGRVVAYDYSRSRVVAPPPRELVAGIVALQGRTSEHHADELQAAADQGFQQPFEAP